MKFIDILKDLALGLQNPFLPSRVSCETLHIKLNINVPDLLGFVKCAETVTYIGPKA